jgi:uncharacterized protein involved in exopolysaccharide biosynthesis
MEENKLITEDIKRVIENLLKIINHYLNRKFVILRNLFVVGSITLIVLLLTKNKYTSTLSFIPPTPDSIQSYSGSLSLALDPSLTLTPKISGGLLGRDPYNLYIQVLRSRKINEEIINKFNLMDKYNVEFIEDMLELMEKKIVEMEFIDGVIFLRVTTDEPELSSKIAKEYSNLLSKTLNDFNVNSAKTTKNFLEKRLKEIKEELDLASKRLTNFQVQNKMIDLEKQGTAIISEIAELQSNIIKSEAELQGLTKIYTENNLKVQSLKASIQTLKKRLSKLVSKNNIYTTIKNGNTEFTVNLLDIPSFAVDYVNLSRTVKILEEVYILVIKEYELAKLNESKDNVVLKILDNGTFPTKKSKPPRTLILIVVMILATFFNILYEGIRYFFNTIKDENKELYSQICSIKNNLFSLKN